MLRATLLTDGPSDEVLRYPLLWLCEQNAASPVAIRWADLRILRKKPIGLRERIQAALAIEPCDLLFVHRDAEKDAPELRHREIRSAASKLLPQVAIVPIRMTEAWLLHNKEALCYAAGRPNFAEKLTLPPARQWESLPDPKDTLRSALRQASGATGRRARELNEGSATHHLAERIADWSPLRQLSAFQRLEADLRETLKTLDALKPPP